MAWGEILAPYIVSLALLAAAARASPQAALTMAVLLDAVTTAYGVAVDLPEAGPLAALVMSVVGGVHGVAAWSVLEFTVLYAFYAVCRARGWVCALALALGPFTAAYFNMLVIASG